MSDSHDLIQRIVSESRELSFRMRVDLIRRLASDTLEFMDARLESGDIEHDELNESIFLRRFVTETDDWSYDSFENSDIPF